MVVVVLVVVVLVVVVVVVVVVVDPRCPYTRCRRRRWQQGRSQIRQCRGIYRAAVRRMQCTQTITASNASTRCPYLRT